MQNQEKRQVIQMSEMIVRFNHDERGIATSWDEVGELVRCKDCKHYRSYAGIIDGFCYMAE